MSNYKIVTKVPPVELPFVPLPSVKALKNIPSIVLPLDSLLNLKEAPPVSLYVIVATVSSPFLISSVVPAVISVVVLYAGEYFMLLAVGSTTFSEGLADIGIG